MKEGQGWARRVTKENLPKLAPFLRKAKEENARQQAALREKEKKLAGDAAPENPFQGIGFKFKTRFTASSKLASRVKTKRRQPDTRKSCAERGQLIYRKVLKSSDVERPPSPTGHVKGCATLARAKFKKADGTLIDQKTYFREEAFAGQKWSELKGKRHRHFTEETLVDFHIVIRGKDYGIVPLYVQHKPSGVSAQGNSPTTIRWGTFSATIRSKVQPGRLLEIFAPAHSNEPFLLQIS